MFKRIVVPALLALGGILTGCTSNGDGSGSAPDTDQSTDPLVCGATRCGTGDTCRVANGQGVCVSSVDAGKAPVEAPTSCAAVLCPENTYCDDLGGSARCIPLPSCDDTRCEDGQHCALQEVQCVRAPCPPQPSCVPDAPTSACATVLCKPGTHCEEKAVQCIRAPCPAVAECVPDGTSPSACAAVLCKAGTRCVEKEVQCIRAPCPPVAECVPIAGTACGENTCSAREFCCNASCGTCAPLGGACTQQVCEAKR